MRTLEHPAPAEFTLDAVLAALADPFRRQIARCLDAEPFEKACGTFGLELSPSTLTHHFRVLREAGVIRQRYQGTAILNSLRREDLETRFPGLLDAILRADPEPAAAATPAPAAGRGPGPS